jgi:hypothetical protein
VGSAALAAAGRGAYELVVWEWGGNEEASDGPHPRQQPPLPSLGQGAVGGAWGEGGGGCTCRGARRALLSSLPTPLLREEAGHLGRQGPVEGAAFPRGHRCLARQPFTSLGLDVGWKGSIDGGADRAYFAAALGDSDVMRGGLGWRLYEAEPGR